MNTNFNKAIDFVLKWEGYKSNHPADPGKLTIFGIASKFYPEEVAKMDKMSIEDARRYASEIYRREYWDKCACDSLPYPMDIIVMDTAVNMGVSKAIELKNKSTSWADYLFQRIRFYNRIAEKNPVFLIGWINRALALYSLCNPNHPLSEYKES